MFVGLVMSWGIVTLEAEVVGGFFGVVVRGRGNWYDHVVWKKGGKMYGSHVRHKRCKVNGRMATAMYGGCECRKQDPDVCGRKIPYQ